MPESPGLPPRELLALVRKLSAEFVKKGKPRPGEWLHSRNEPGQTFLEYTRINPILPNKTRRTIYILPLGAFSEDQRRVLEEARTFFSIFFSVPCQTLEDVPAAIIPRTEQRIHPRWGDHQLKTPYILRHVVRQRLPRDSLCGIALTALDLYPRDSWNFVFGQASLRARVGVWSIYRNGDPSESAEAFRRCVLRTCKTGAHEICHMLSMKHCTAYECAMGGSNTREESDARPAFLCPQCVAKLLWGCRADAAARYAGLAAWYARLGFEHESALAARLRALAQGSAPH